MKLKEIATIKSGKHFAKDTEVGDCLLIRPKNISTNNELILKDETFIKCDDDTHLLENGDIVMNITGSVDNIGNFYVYNLPIPAIASESIVVIKSDDKEIVEKLKKAYYKIKTLVSGGTAIPKIFIKDLENLEV